MTDYAVTVTPTVMDGTVVRWHPGGDPSRPAVISASRNGVIGHGGRLYPSLFASAWDAHRRLVHGDDVQGLATHDRTKVFGGEWKRVGESV